MAERGRGKNSEVTPIGRYRSAQEAVRKIVNRQAPACQHTQKLMATATTRPLAEDEALQALKHLIVCDKCLRIALGAFLMSPRRHE